MFAVQFANKETNHCVNMRQAINFVVNMNVGDVTQRLSAGSNRDLEARNKQHRRWMRLSGTLLLVER
jgi:hypothetical protein